MIVVEAAKRSKLTIVVDENVSQLMKPLRELQYKVLGIEKGMSDERIMELLDGWCILTRNTKDFKMSAVIYDFDIIDISNLKFIDDDQTAKNKTAKLISGAIRESEFYNRRGNWMLTVSPDGPHRLVELK